MTADGGALTSEEREPWSVANDFQVLVPPRMNKPARPDGGRSWEVLNMDHREDAALIVAAVNDYERLLRIAETVRLYRVQHADECSCEACNAYEDATDEVEPAALEGTK